MASSENEDYKNQEQEQKEQKPPLNWKDILALIIAILWQMSPLFLFFIFMIIIVYILLILVR